MALCTHYDPSVDAAVIFFRRHAKSARTDVLDESRMIDYDAQGQVAFVELLDVSKGVNLDGLPQREAIERELSKLQTGRRRQN